MFEKRVMIFEKRDREAWTRIKTALKSGGIRGVRSGHYSHEDVTVGGCGAKLDPRDFGKKGKIDREIYWIRVPEKDAERILESLAAEGIVPEVDETVNLTAPERAEQRLRKRQE